MLLYIQLIFALFRISFASDNITNVDDMFESFYAKLPEAYRCCAEADTLQNFDWQILCKDKKSGQTYNISIGCEMAHYSEVTSNKPKHYRLFIEDGEVFHGYKNNRRKISSNSTCFGNGTLTKASDVLMILCIEDEMGSDKSSESKVLSAPAGILSLVSAPFVAVVIVAYALIPEVKDLQGQSILCLCCSYLVSFLLIANENLGILEMRIECHGGGDILFFSLMACIFWMNAISIQTFVTIRFPNLDVPWRKQFLCYSCYSWGIPSMFLLFAIIGDIAPSSMILRSMDLSFNCFTADKVMQWKYYLGPMTAAILTSCLLHLLSALLLWKKSAEPDFETLRDKFMLSVKLFGVVGISWLNEPLQVIHGQNNIIWAIGDCWNALQGLLLFVVLVLLRKSVFNYLFMYLYAFLKICNVCAFKCCRRHTDGLTDEDAMKEDLEENGLPNVNINSKEEGDQ